MKRTVLACSLILIAAGALSAQAITVNQPSHGDIWVKGKPGGIVWTSTGSLPNQVRISLRNAASTAEVLVIADPAPNTSPYTLWTPPASVPDGTYVIRVKAKGVAVHGDSVPFVISIQPEIHITDPRNGAIWAKKTRSTTITWSHVGKLPRTINIDLVDQYKTKVIVIAKGEQNLGTFTWTYPSDLKIGDYFVQVWIPLNPNEDSQVIRDAHTVRVIY